MPPELKDVVPSAALVFTVLTFFGGKRWDHQLDAGRTKPLSMPIFVNAVPELLVGAAAALAAVVLWPLLDESPAFSSLTDPQLTLANLFAIVWAGFVLLGVAMASLFAWRVVGGVYLHSRVGGLLVLMLLVVACGYAAMRIL